MLLSNDFLVKQQGGATAMPNRPVISVPLTHPGLVSRVAGAVCRLRYSMI
jgi:hypothetical protein